MASDKPAEVRAIIAQSKKLIEELNALLEKAGADERFSAEPIKPEQPDQERKL